MSHNCQGSRCVCQRYENGELAAVMMNQGRNNPEREDGGYQNAVHVSRGFQSRPNNTVQIPPNLNPNYQNPIDLVRNYNRGRLLQQQQPQQQQQQQQQEPEENIYERLDNDDDDANAEVSRNEPSQNHQINANHTYERIGDRLSCNGRAHCRAYKYHGLNHVPAHSIFLSDAESGGRNAGQYDQPRHIYVDYSRLSGGLCQSSLSRLGRNCFSTENIAYASSMRRSVQPFAYNCACSYCRHADARYICHHCHNLHNRLRYQDAPAPAAAAAAAAAAATTRHYVYQIARNCRCPFCRGEHPYAKFPAAAASVPRAPAELLRMECCHCRNLANCTCRGKILPDSSSAIYVGRYLDWINRTGQSVNNPLYAMIHVGRIDRGHGTASNGGNPSAGAADLGPSTSNGGATSSSSTVLRTVFAPGTSSAPYVSICPVNRYVTERQHICDDSCIRSQSGNLAGICQLLGRCERTECNHGRLSVHWWFVNKWLPLWTSHNLDRNADGAAASSSVDEVSREQRESDSDDS